MCRNKTSLPGGYYSGIYWSSTPGSSGNYFVVRFSDCNYVSNSGSSEANSHYVKCVK
jgi:hypothetical protein